MEVNEILKKVKKIEIKTKAISQHLFSGEYNSAFKGRGMSFSEVREYSYGDDVRHIDWNVTARTNYPHIKVFEEEREMNIMFLIDVSKSAMFGTSEYLKSDYITELCAVLAFSAMTNNDKVGAILFSDEIEHYIPPKKGKKQILRIIRELVDSKTENQGTDLGKALKYLTNTSKKRATVFVLSDFIDTDFQDALKITSKKHDLIGIKVYDKGERELPNLGLIKVMDQETKEEVLLDTSSAASRRKYTEQFDERTQSLEQTFSQLKGQLLSIGTEEDYIKVLLKFFKKRAS
jgi:uncharacterized protein (DUF58 family)